MDETPQWYLNVQGTVVGPYTLNKLREILEQGQIADDQQVTHPSLDSQWITLQQALQGNFSIATSATSESKSEPTLSSGKTENADFHPPPRPELSQSEGSKNRSDMRPSGEDATDQLLEALRIARERQEIIRNANRSARLEASQHGRDVRRKRFAPSQIWTAVIVCLILVISVWGMSRLSQKDSPPTQASAGSPPTQIKQPRAIQPKIHIVKQPPAIQFKKIIHTPPPRPTHTTQPKVEPRDSRDDRPIESDAPQIMDSYPDNNSETSPNDDFGAPPHDQNQNPEDDRQRIENSNEDTGFRPDNPALGAPID